MISETSVAVEIVVIDSVGDKDSFFDRIIGRKEDPANTDSTTSSVAMDKSNAGSREDFLDLRGLEDSRMVFVFFSRLVDTFLLVSLIFE